MSRARIITCYLLDAGDQNCMNVPTRTSPSPTSVPCWFGCSDWNILVPVHAKAARKTLVSPAIRLLPEVVPAPARFGRQRRQAGPRRGSPRCGERRLAFEFTDRVAQALGEDWAKHVLRPPSEATRICGRSRGPSACAACAVALAVRLVAGALLELRLARLGPPARFCMLGSCAQVAPSKAPEWPASREKAQFRTSRAAASSQKASDPVWHSLFRSLWPGPAESQRTSGSAQLGLPLSLIIQHRCEQEEEVTSVGKCIGDASRTAVSRLADTRDRPVQLRTGLWKARGSRLTQSRPKDGSGLSQLLGSGLRSACLAASQLFWSRICRGYCTGNEWLIVLGLSDVT